MTCHKSEEGQVVAGTVASVVVFLLVIGLIVGACQTVPSYNRHQARLSNEQHRDQALRNERNQTTINDIKIAQTAQLVKVHQQEADIRVVDAKGIAIAQNIIGAKLTPAYLQYEAIQAQMKMANSENHTLMWIPSGANGVPTVSTINPQQVADGQ